MATGGRQARRMPQAACSPIRATRALPSLRFALAPMTKGECGDSVSAKDGRDFHPWVYALAAIRWQRKIPVYAMICRGAFVRELHHHSDGEREILLCDENRFADFIGKALVDKIREHGSEETAAINSLLSKLEKKARSVTPEERDFLRAMEAVTQAAADEPINNTVRERWMAGQRLNP